LHQTCHEANSYTKVLEILLRPFQTTIHKKTK
jgi:hypothetical protein